MTNRSLEALEFQIELLKLSGLARQSPHPEIKTIVNLADSCRDISKQTSANAVRNHR
jgi:hypothetical protein